MQQALKDDFKAPPLKPLTPCPLEIHYLYTEKYQIRFDKTAVERVHIAVSKKDIPGSLVLHVVLKTEDARVIYRKLLERGAAKNPAEATC